MRKPARSGGVPELRRKISSRSPQSGGFEKRDHAHGSTRRAHDRAREGERGGRVREHTLATVVRWALMPEDILEDSLA